MANGIDVIALGGNAIIPVGGKGTIDEQRNLTSDTMRQVAGLIASGRKVVLTHGNGPIVGNIVERNEAIKDRIPPMPLDVCGADSQGGIGYMIQQSLRNELEAIGISREVVSIVSQVVVDERDEAFQNPTKPIGPFYTREESDRLALEKGWAMRNDADRGYRRVVPSPMPIEIVEAGVISRLLADGTVVIAVGGGGVPVIRKEGRLRGIEAVIDKDRAAAVLARNAGAERLIILTSVEEVYVNFGGPDQEALGEVRLEEIEKLYEAGEFPAGSMGPKIEAAMDFIESDGRMVIISHARRLLDACKGTAGTRIIPD
ncbi:MAG TPA: carbamate kinase [Candidatus Eisenbacteria bacterium]|uniref:Carbamate kinase n=1 Tax=Eiseniibacteriota bacterium TaxID=2212470 RepID=A0A7V2AWC2_UNCEI|nr:carbamate kinase [Candidatus Eisenbacteria bacterium]